MTDYPHTTLDLSRHSLNNSNSKLKYSFPKSDRFNTLKSPICDNLYEIPTTRSHRTTSFGYGNKTIGIKIDKNLPEPGTYKIPSDFQNNKNKKGAYFGQGRQKLQITGPMREVLLKRFVPGPGNYQSDYSTLVVPPITLKSRILDRSVDHLKKLPGPGAYNHEQIGTSQYYASSKHPFGGVPKFSPSKKLQPINRSSTLGPGTYDCKSVELNPQGRYFLSNYQNSRSRVFSKSKRQQIINKNQLSTPGPGNYGTFSTFG